MVYLEHPLRRVSDGLDVTIAADPFTSDNSDSSITRLGHGDLCCPLMLTPISKMIYSDPSATERAVVPDARRWHQRSSNTNR